LQIAPYIYIDGYDGYKSFAMTVLPQHAAPQHARVHTVLQNGIHNTVQAYNRMHLFVFIFLFVFILKLAEETVASSSATMPLRDGLN